MLGMNNVIHHDYPAKFDFTEGAKKYAETIRKQVKEYQASGAAVMLMKPTLTDETENSYFSPRTQQARIRWSVEGTAAAGEENVILEKGKAFVFTPPIPAVALPAKLGRIARVFMSVTPADGCPRLVCVLALLNEYERMDKDERRMTPCASETVSCLAVQLGSSREARAALDYLDKRREDMR